jgi:toxin ParE1/3/4
VRSRRIRFLAAAAAELRAAAVRYNAEQKELGAEFTTEVEMLTKLLLRHPGLGRPTVANTRRAVLARFPYSVVYRADDGGITIVAVAHHRRHPDYWLERTNAG